MDNFSTNDLGFSEFEYTNDKDGENVAVCPGCMNAYVLSGYALFEYLDSNDFYCEWCAGDDEDEYEEY